MLHISPTLMERAQATLDAFAPAHERRPRSAPVRPQPKPKPKAGREAFEALFAPPPERPESN